MGCRYKIDGMSGPAGNHPSGTASMAGPAPSFQEILNREDLAFNFERESRDLGKG